MRARLDDLRARRQRAAADFHAAKKERDALSASLQERDDWKEQFESARREFKAARKRLGKIAGGTPHAA